MANFTTTKKKNYIKGSARQKQFDNGGTVINLDLLVSEVQAIANEKGYAKITLSELREPDMYGNTHSIYQNDWVPDAKATPQGVKDLLPAKQATKPAGKKSYDATDDLPF